jgi:transposase
MTKLSDDSLNTGSPHNLCQLPTNGGIPSEKCIISEREMWWNQNSVDDQTKQWRQRNARRPRRPAQAGMALISPSQDRVKTDQRDAERVLRLLMIDGLHAVRVPSTEEEALRDLIRAREDLRGDLMRARQRLSKLLLRHDIRYEDNASAWTARHRAWLTRIDLGPGGAQATLLDYLGAIDTLVTRRDSMQATLAQLGPDSPWAQTIARLRCLRGIDTLSAVALCAEVGDFDRFDRPAKLMSYLGLVPSENSSGETRRQGAITKTGSRHARRLLVEAAWHYRRHPREARRSSAARTASGAVPGSGGK